MTLLLGRKQGMTQIFREDGSAVGVTVVAAGPCVVCDVRTPERNGYHAVQLGYETVPDRKLAKPELGAFKKAGVAPQRFLREERVASAAALKVGDTVTVEAFKVGDQVDVRGVMKGRGFAGTIRRHGFQRGPEGHGSMNVRAPGSISSKRIGSVAKGKRMAGHYGSVNRAVKNLRIERIDGPRNLLFVGGPVPGPTGGFVQVSSARTPRRAASAPSAPAKKDAGAKPARQA
jgi:large subunit ribosomal protein L3